MTAPPPLHKPTYPDYPVDQAIPMHRYGPWPPAVHRFKAPAAAALRAAEATGRPLLIRGLPGVGKSMTARAAAAAAGRPLLAQVIDGRTEAPDLMAKFDAVRRLADAQVLRGIGAGLAAESAYLRPQVLWWAFDWCGATDQQRLAKALQIGDDAANALPDTELEPVPVPAGWRRGQDRCVLLLDEIDKADPDLPNALLEVLGENRFTVALTGQVVECPAARRPLIVMTTNEERELPAAVLRRCLVLTLTLPTDANVLVKELVAIGEQHQRWLMHPDVAQRQGQCLVLRQAAQAIADARRLADGSSYQPGTSEFLDLVAALAELWPDDKAEQRKQLRQIKGYMLDKSAPAVA